MRSTLLTVLMTSTLLAGSAHAADLVLKRAVLGTGGVGYFEYSAEVSGDETLTLRARLDQVDDILKSLIILDPAGPGSATLPGKQGASETFASLPFGQSDLDSMPALMSALKGAEIKVESPRRIEGRIASVQTETITDKDGRQMTRTRVSVFAGGRLEQFVLEEAEGLSFSDARLGEQVESALKAVRASQDRSGRDIAIRLAKGEKRTVRIGYVAESPVWKTAYRLTMPAAKEETARLQGWVVLENMTGNPWKDVSVTLSSASPVTFRQSLYEPYYVSRQTIAPPVSQTAMPRMDAGQQMVAGEADMPVTPAAAAPASPSLRLQRAKNYGSASDVDRGGGAMTYNMSQTQEPGSSGEENTAGASFTLSQTVSVGSGESLTIPFVDRKVPAQSVAWYQQGRNPWLALSLRNDGATALPAGSATIYEQTEAGPLFSGDAQFPLLPAGDSRLIGFGADQKVQVNSDERSSSTLMQVRSVDGTLRLQMRGRRERLFRVKNLAGDVKHMVIEEPRYDDWTLIEPKPTDAKLSGDVYRIRFDVDPNSEKTYKVAQERTYFETLDIGEIRSERFTQLLSDKQLDADTRKRLQTVADAARDNDTAQAELSRLSDERGQITGDQERLRENLRAAPQGSDLARLYAQKMLDQEKALDALDKKVVAAQAKLNAARRVLAERIRTF